MAPKTSKLARLHELAAYVRQPDKLAELQARSGNNLKEKLRQLVPGEKLWYLFFYKSKGFGSEGQALLAELDAEVTRQPRAASRIAWGLFEQLSDNRQNDNCESPATQTPTSRVRARDD